MNAFQTDYLLELAKEKHQEDVDSRLALKAVKSPALHGNHWLAALGAWMVAKGEKLQARHAASMQANQLGFSQGRIKKARAH
jgi:hypothetical protein